ncbi:palmitoyltransferase ZDHHC21-like [Babylonia areolata]|uniref:palmitoyltransferase ZDHHC21-like n=1 Tax=Babylonia areolata TaxID=304850 RepID=UPI003FCF1916
METNFLHNVSSIIPKPRHNSDYASPIVVRSLPFIGRIHIVNDVSGMIQLGCVLAYWVYGTLCTLYIILLPQYHDGRIPFALVLGYMFISVMCLLALVKASITNPGRIPLASEEPSADTSDWTFCHTCLRKRPPRSHHCRRCQQCVMRMDHHCPWINNCVGEENHSSFLLLLFYAFLLGASTFLLCMLHFWVWPKCQSCDKEVFYIKHNIIFLYILVAMAVNMALVMFCQLGNQHINLRMDRTTLETMQMLEPQDGPYVRKTYAAYRELCGRGLMLCWLWPCRRPSSAFKSHTASAV